MLAWRLLPVIVVYAEVLSKKSGTNNQPDNLKGAYLSHYSAWKVTSVPFSQKGKFGRIVVEYIETDAFKNNYTLENKQGKFVQVTEKSAYFTHTVTCLYM